MPLLPPVPEHALNPFEYMYFSSEEQSAQIDNAIADYLVREDQMDVARSFTVVSHSLGDTVPNESDGIS